MDSDGTARYRQRPPALRLTLRLMLFLLLMLPQSSGEFTPHFRNFLQRRYGSNALEELERLDMGTFKMGSFGGREYVKQQVSRRPVIFVHGVTLRAGAFLQHSKFFLEHGYSPAELYATTYGDGGLTTLFAKKMECKDVKLIREFIVAVAEYTKSKVDVIAYSMGVAISRKAILGGQCVDTLESLGPALTDLVDTYVGMGGVGYGFEGCSTYGAIWDSCNEINGMSCKSKFLADLNSKPKRFEAENSYAIYSVDDHLVGQKCCGKVCSEIPHSNETFTKHALDHVGIMWLTKELQFSLLNHRASRRLHH